MRAFLCAGLVGVATLWAVPILAQSTEARTMMTAIADLGCVVSEENEAAFLEAMDLGSAALETAGNELLDAGLLQFQDGALVLVGGACADTASEAPPAPQTLVATMIALRDNGCVVTEAGADALFLPLGARDVIMGHLRDLDAVNLIHLSSSFSGAVVAERVCDAPDGVIESFAAQVSDMLALPERNRLDFVASRTAARALYVEWLVAQGCRTPNASSTDGMRAFGFENTLAAVTVPLLDAGVLESSETHLSVAPELCAGSAVDRRAAVAALPSEDAQFD